ncbi:MAG TPA: hypothetical protein VES88_12040 [Gemmatimonadaceae bacterium]|nr:hypothetical protein [Gemmatimonadaceae bacterium]
MYISLAWAPFNEANAHQIEAEVIAVVMGGEFVNVYVPFHRFILANIRKGKTRDEIKELQTDLRVIAKDRFSFIIAASPLGWSMARSTDIPKDKCDGISDYG